MLNILHDVDLSVSGGNRPTVTWNIVNVTKNSPLVLTVSGISTQKVGSTREIITGFIEGLRCLEESARHIPPHFSIETLKYAKTLASYWNHIENIEFFTAHGSIAHLTSQTAVNAEKLMGKVFEEYATFEGRLETLSIHGGFSFNLYNEDIGCIPCTFEENLLDSLKEYFAYRVLVYGTVKYSSSYCPLSLRVEQIRRLRDKEELPQFQDLEGINLTDGVDSTEYVRSIRSGDGSFLLG